MNLTIRWGSLEPLMNDKHTLEVVDKQKAKILRELKNDASNVVVSFDLDNKTKRYLTTITAIVPKDKIRIEKVGYTLEESFTEAANDFKNVVRRHKDKVITLHRKESLRSFIF